MADETDNLHLYVPETADHIRGESIPGFAANFRDLDTAITADRDRLDSLETGGGGAGVGDRYTRPPAAPVLDVDGNRFVDSNGDTVILRGVNSPGAEYACQQLIGGDGTWGWGVFDSGTATNTDAMVSALSAWSGVNCVRITSNSGGWLGYNVGVGPGHASALYNGTAYQDAMIQCVTRWRTAGFYVILDIHWARPDWWGPARAQQDMLDVMHGAAAWELITSIFGADRGVIFNLYNEPTYPALVDVAPWSAWRDGGWISSYRTGSGQLVFAGPGEAATVAVPYAAIGHQALVDTVRNRGGLNILLLDGIDFANDLSGWLGWMPVDPLNRLAADIHTYSWNTNSPNNNPAIFLSVWEPLAAQVPVVIGEIGDDSGSGTPNPPLFAPKVLNWAERHGVSHLAWAWTTWAGGSGLDLVTSVTAGTPTEGFGQYYKDFVRVAASGAPQLAEFPANATTHEGLVVAFHAGALGTPTPTAQWQRSNNGGSTWANISGETSSTLTLSPLESDSGAKFRIVYTNTHGTATSSAVTLTVLEPLDIALVESPTPKIAWGTSVAESFDAIPNHLYVVSVRYETGDVLTDDLGDGAPWIEVATWGNQLVKTYYKIATGSGRMTVTLAGVLKSQRFVGRHYATSLPGSWILSGTPVTRTNFNYVPTPITIGPTASIAAGDLVLAFADGQSGTAMTNEAPEPLNDDWQAAWDPQQGMIAVQDNLAWAGGTATATWTWSPLADQQIDGIVFGFHVRGPSLPVISEQPQTQSSIVGYPITYSTAAHGFPVPWVQWQKRLGPLADWVNVTTTGDHQTPDGEVHSSLTVTPPPEESSSQYRAWWHNDAGDTYSDIVSVTFATPVAPAFTTDLPSTVTAHAGDEHIFTVVVTGLPTPTLQWQQKVATTWSDISGATSSSYTTSTLQPGDSGVDIRCVATNIVAAVNSTECEVTVVEPAYDYLVRDTYATPPSGANDGINLTVGEQFEVTANATCAGVTFYNSEAIGATTVFLWSVTGAGTGTLLASKVIASPVIGWNDVIFDTAVDLTSTPNYVVGYNVTHYNYRAATMDGAALTSTTAPARTATHFGSSGAGCYATGSNTIPNTGSAAWYAVDPIFFTN